MGEPKYCIAIICPTTWQQSSDTGVQRERTRFTVFALKLLADLNLPALLR